jgi:hypothetical protein
LWTCEDDGPVLADDGPVRVDDGPVRAEAGTAGPPEAGTSSAGRTLTRGGATIMLRCTKAPSCPVVSELPRPDADAARPPGNRRAGGMPKSSGPAASGRCECDAAARTVEGSAVVRRITEAAAVEAIPVGLADAVL